MNYWAQMRLDFMVDLIHVMIDPSISYYKFNTKIHESSSPLNTVPKPHSLPRSGYANALAPLRPA